MRISELRDILPASAASAGMILSIFGSLLIMFLNLDLVISAVSYPSSFRALNMGAVSTTSPNEDNLIIIAFKFIPDLSEK